MKLQNFILNKKYLFLASLGLAVVMFLVTLFFFIQAPQVGDSNLSREEVAQLVKPAVVRIVQHVTGDYALPAVLINLNNLTFTSNPSTGRTKVDDYVAGSGFIVSSDGYILTNAHVIAPEIVENLIAKDALLSSLKQTNPNFNDQNLQQMAQDPASAKFIQQVYDFIKSNANFNFQSQLTVLDPSSSRENIKELASLGLPAAKVDYDPNFEDNDKDVGLVKIAQNNLPTVELKSTSPQVGSQIYVFGFPSTADFNNRTPLESTFTQGVVSAVKYSENKDFKLVQTDAKISEGSSGGPLFNANGVVEWIVTFQTDDITRANGDNFAFAIPIDLGLNILEKNNVQIQEGNFGSHFKAGLSYLHTNQCQKALSEFEQAGHVNYLFSTDKTLAPYISTCQNLIETGQSLDSATALWKNQIGNFTAFEWFVIIGRILLVSFGFAIILLLASKIRKDEDEISSIETQLATPTIKHRGLTVPIPEEGLYSLPNSKNSQSALVQNYFSQARQAGLRDHHIIEDLKRAGWDDDTINEAIIGTS